MRLGPLALCPCGKELSASQGLAGLCFDCWSAGFARVDSAVTKTIIEAIEIVDRVATLARAPIEVDDPDLDSYTCVACGETVLHPWARRPLLPYVPMELLDGSHLLTSDPRSKRCPGIRIIQVPDEKPEPAWLRVAKWLVK